jgi:hypothetical protein
LKRAQGTDTETIFATELGSIRNFRIITPPRKHTLGSLTGGIQNPPTIMPTGPGSTALRKIINERFEYFEYFPNILQCLGSDTLSKREHAKKLADLQATILQNTTPSKPNLDTISKRPTKRPLGAFDSKIKSDVTDWKQAVNTHFD